MKTQTHFLTLFFTLFLVFLPEHLARAQAPENLILLLEQNRLDEIRERLPEVARQYPDNPAVLYLQAILESSAEKAIKLYNEILEKHSTSIFADDALLRLAQHDFAKGLYIAAGRKYARLPCQFPSSPLCDDAHYMRIQCLQARGVVDSAAFALEWFLTNYPQSAFANIAADEISGQEEHWTNRKTQPSSSVAERPKERYAIQIGAFKDRKNAQRMEQALRSEGYVVEIRKKERGRDTFHLVWVGTFRTENKALEFGREFRERFGLPFRVVKR